MARKKSSQQEVMESAHKVWLAGLGAMALAGEEGRAMFQALVEKGEEYEQRGRKQVDRAKGKVKDARAGIEVMVGRFSEKFDDSVAGALQRLGVPTRKEISTLTKRVEELTRSIEKMKPAARKATARRPAAKRAAPAAGPTTGTSA